MKTHQEYYNEIMAKAEKAAKEELPYSNDTARLNFIRGYLAAAVAFKQKEIDRLNEDINKLTKLAGESEVHPVFQNILNGVTHGG